MLFFFLLLTSAGNAQLFQTDLERGFKALDKNEYDKAIGYFTGELEDDSANAGANYGIAQVYFSKNYSGFNAEKAYGFIVQANSDYRVATKKQLSSFTKLNVTQATIDDLKARIDDEIYGAAAATYSVTLLQDFIDKYPDNKNVPEAKMLIEQLTVINVSNSNSEEALDDYIRKNPQGKNSDKLIKVRNQLAFQKAKATNTIEALREFIVKYPDAEEIAEAQTALATLEFAAVKQQNTIAAYDTFMTRYPDALEFREAEMLRNQLAYIQLLEQQSTQQSADLAKADAKIEQTGNWLNAVLAGFAAVIILAFVVYRSYLDKKRSNKEITQQKEIIEQKNTEIVDSINYAKRIQNSMLPSLDEIRRHLPETFVFYRPRNIVSGDFYWFAQTGDRVYIAAADCTGHGVPGSLVSMIGFNFLNQVVNEMGITDPGEILDELHKRISMTLNKDQSTEHTAMRDGMDIALLSINRATNEITFSGAVRPLVYVDDEGIKSIRSGMYSIGGIKDLHSDLYPTHRVKTKGKATFYLFSDGYADQFGGPQGKKFKMKKLQELLAAASKESMQRQEQIIAREFEQWMGRHEQVDDVCVIGVRY